MSKHKMLALIVLVGAFLFYCEAPKREKADLVTMNEDSIKNRPVIYQVMTRLFGNKTTTNRPWGTLEENGVGKFADITTEALSAIKKMGVTHIWYTGVIEHGLLTDYTGYGMAPDDADVIKGRAGSPYAIKDYYDVNPDLATSVPDRISEFEQLVARTHHEGLKVIIDFVPNHVARSYHSDQKPPGVKDFGAADDTSRRFHPQNNFYYIPGTAFEVPEGRSLPDHPNFPARDSRYEERPARATGNDVFSHAPSAHDWYETVKLNYGVDYENGKSKHFDPIPDTWKKMRNILLYWAAKEVDGFRCDMAEMVPVEFWEWAIAQVKEQYPDIVFIAEIYNPEAYRDYIFTGGFDFLYDKVELYDLLKRIVRKQSTTDDLTPIWQRQESIGDYMLRFLENHDEQRIASPYFAGDMPGGYLNGIPMMAVTAFMHRGPVMMYFGQEVGEPGYGDSGFSSNDGRTTIFDYWGVPEHQKWMNDGRFDGGRLSKEQKALRQRYSDILTACNELREIRQGDFFDLHYFNRNDQYTGYSDRVYAFIRHTDTSALLIVTNFSDSEEQARIKIPAAALEEFGFSLDKILFSEGPGKKLWVDRTSLLDYSKPSGLVVRIPPLSYQIYRMDQR